MSQRPSGYARIPGDRYITPAWPVEALVPHLPAISAFGNQRPGRARWPKSCAEPDTRSSPQISPTAPISCGRRCHRWTRS